MFVFKRVNTPYRQQMITEKFFHKTLINFSIIYLQFGDIFQLNYIERISCRYSIYGFYTIWLVYMACFTELLSSMIACYWKSMYQELKEVKSWNVTDWSIMMKVHESFVHVWNCSCKFDFFLFDRSNWNSQCPR